MQVTCAALGAELVATRPTRRVEHRTHGRRRRSLRAACGTPLANVYVCAATKLNANVSMCFAFLKSAIGTFQVRKEWFCCRRTRKRERKKMTFFSHSARTLKGSKRRFYVYDASREESYAASLLFFPRDILSRVFVDVSLRAPPRGKED